MFNNNNNHQLPIKHLEKYSKLSSKLFTDLSDYDPLMEKERSFSALVSTIFTRSHEVWGHVNLKRFELFIGIFLRELSNFMENTPIVMVLDDTKSFSIKGPE